MVRVPLILSNLQSDALVDYRSAGTGVLRIPLVIAGGVVPVAVGGAAFVFWRHSLEVKDLFPAAAIFAGALTGTASMLFSRVKDLAAQPRPEIGRDPVLQASVVFRSALYCAQTALLLNAILVTAAIMPPGTGAAAMTCFGIALFVHMGMKVLMLLQGLRAQMLATAGSRAQGPIPAAKRAQRAS